jgi:tRNA-Thr(GGU) m(6)t(6)A37 methyltransferase TsaA
MSALTISPIGVLRTPFRTVADCPRNGRLPQPPPDCTAEVLPEFRDGLRGLETFSHLILLYWMDRSPDTTLVFTPPFDDTPRGVFATRAPWRPSRIALAVVAFDGMDDGVLRVRYLDCMDGTPLLDIKPYLPRTDAEPEASMGWLARHG